MFIGKGFEPGVTNILKTTQGSKIYLKGVSAPGGLSERVRSPPAHRDGPFPFDFSSALCPAVTGERHTSGERTEIQGVRHHDHERRHPRGG